MEDAADFEFRIGDLKMNIKGKKVLLRAIEPEDLTFLTDLQNSGDIEEMCGSWDFPLSLERETRWYQNIKVNSDMRLIIECIGSGQTIGTIYLNNIDWKNRKAFIGIKTIPGSTRGKGYGLDAIMTLLRYAFDELQMHRIESLIVDYNSISLHYLDKFGLKPEGVCRECFFSRGKYHNKIYIGVLETDYQKIVEATRYWEEDQ